jgi:hypothetical protein
MRSMDLNGLAQNGERWQDLVNAVKIFGFFKMWGIS